MKRVRKKKNVPDVVLITGYLNGDTEAFNILYDRYKRQLYAYLNRMVPGQTALVDDIFQQTWIKVVHQLPKYQSRQRFLAWIIRIGHNQAIDHFRKIGKHEVALADDEGSENLAREEQEPWEGLDRNELGKALTI